MSLEPGPELDRALSEALEYMPDLSTMQYHALSTSPYGMHMLMDSMEKRGWLTTIESGLSDYCGTCLRREAWGKKYYRDGDIYQAHHATRAGAFALAAAAALGLGKDAVELAMDAAADHVIKEE